MYVFMVCHFSGSRQRNRKANPRRAHSTNSDLEMDGGYGMVRHDDGANGENTCDCYESDCAECNQRMEQ